MSIIMGSRKLVRYCIVGVVNTIITACVIFFLIKSGVDLYISNAIGYISGVLFSFIANSIFTFHVNIGFKKFFKFIIVCLICWVLNIIAIKIFLYLFLDYIFLSQVIGMCVYTLAGFILNKVWGMK